MAKKNPPEILYFSAEDINKFMQAVKNASKLTIITNSSIFKMNDREVEIHDTKAAFLIQVGVEWNKILQKEKDDKGWDRVKNHLKESK